MSRVWGATPHIKGNGGLTRCRKTNGALFGRARQSLLRGVWIGLLRHPSFVLFRPFSHVERSLVPPDRAAFALIFFEMRACGLEFANKFGDFGFVHGLLPVNRRLALILGGFVFGRLASASGVQLKFKQSAVERAVKQGRFF